MYLRKVTPLQYLVILYSIFHGLSGVLITVGVGLKSCMMWLIAIQGLISSYEIIQLCIGIYVFLITFGIKQRQKLILSFFTFIAIAIPFLMVICTIFTDTVSFPTADASSG
jgi:hypothetical protein